MKICLRLHQLLAIYSNTNENWDYHEMSLKVADIFDKRDEMKKDLDRVDAKEAVFAENVKAKFSFQKLMYLSVTVNEIRYYTYGHLGYLYDTYMFQLKNSPIWSKLKAVQNNKAIYADYLTYMLGFGIVSQEIIMKQIADEWGLN